MDESVISSPFIPSIHHYKMPGWTALIPQLSAIESLNPLFSAAECLLCQ